MRCKKAPSLRGFTLTELAIVLGIIGVILGAIWTAAAKVYANNRVAKAVTEVLTVAQSIRATYNGKGVFPSQNINLTVAGGKFGWYPADMIQNTTCVDGSNPCPTTPWNSGMMVYGGVPLINQFAIAIQTNPFGGGTGKDCPAFMAAIVAQATSAGIIGFISNANGNAYVTITNTTAITDPAIAGCVGDVVLYLNL